MVNPLDGLITRDDIADIATSEGLILNDDKRISVLEAMHSIDVQACPGSGKTTLIAAKLILLAKKWPFQHQGICVLSHTNVAKNEIIDRLKKSKTPEAHRLLSYPHFIGTIQEFVNRFLALPMMRRSGVSVRFLTDTDGVKEVLNSGENLNSIYTSLYHKLGGKGIPYPKNTVIYQKIIKSLGSIFWLNTDLDIGFYGEHGKLIKYKNDPGKKVFPMLKSLKEAIEKKGCYQYRDMFVFANQLVSKNEKIKQSIQKRFPLVFLDEMQDTQRFQDDLLCKIFPVDDSLQVVQRFGDPDQAIFHGIDGEEPNISFNAKRVDGMDVIINKSHRFDNGIAEKIRRLSFNEVQLETELSEEALAERTQCSNEGRTFEHTVFIFNDESIGNVVLAFAETVSNQFSDEYKRTDQFSVKVIGGVGNAIDPEENQLKIGHYWMAYDKAKSKVNFKENSLIEAVRYCRQSTTSDWAGSYKLLSDCILKILRILGKQDQEGKYFNSTSIRVFLKGREKWNDYRQLLYVLLERNCKIDQETWEQVIRDLVSIFDISGVPVELEQYLSFSEDEASANTVPDSGIEEEKLIHLPENMILHSDGFRIELSTIHGVKGETHDATLVLETKHHCFDLGIMLPYLTGEWPNNEYPNANLLESPHWNANFKSNKKFMRQFYVAMSRPKHLLCLAVHSDRIIGSQKQCLRYLGWKVKELPTIVQRA